jgi:hypothetical protein
MINKKERTMRPDRSDINTIRRLADLSEEERGDD